MGEIGGGVGVGEADAGGGLHEQQGAELLEGAIAEGGATRASVEPEDEGLGGHVGGGLEEPVEEGAAVRLVHRHVPGELPEPKLRRLPRQTLHPVRLLPIEHLLVRLLMMMMMMMPRRRTPRPLHHHHHHHHAHHHQLLPPCHAY
uniref:Uncharacterized protein n=1 Tax=Oryza glumipatula TaxID=40148 RepID=A0A0E0AER8_9ORYZ